MSIADTPLGKYFRRVYMIENVQYNENPVLTTGLVTTAAPVKILAPNSNRISLYIANLSANYGYCAPSASVSSTYGFYLGANSGFLTANIKDDGMLVTKDWYAQNNTADGTWYVSEVIAGV